MRLYALVFLLFLGTCGAGYVRAAPLGLVSTECIRVACGTLDFSWLNAPHDANDASRRTELPSIRPETGGIVSDFHAPSDRLPSLDDEQPEPVGAAISHGLDDDHISSPRRGDDGNESERDPIKGLAAPEPGDMLLVFTGLALVLIGRRKRRVR